MLPGSTLFSLPCNPPVLSTATSHVSIVASHPSTATSHVSNVASHGISALPHRPFTTRFPLLPHLLLLKFIPCGSLARFFSPSPSSLRFLELPLFSHLQSPCHSAGFAPPPRRLLPLHSPTRVSYSPLPRGEGGRGARGALGFSTSPAYTPPPPVFLMTTMSHHTYI